MTTRPNHPKNAGKRIAEYITQMARNVVKASRTNGLWQMGSVTEDDYKEWAEMLASCEKEKERTVAKIEVGKTYKTREGRSARILATNLDGDFPIVGLIDNIKIVTWTSEGLSGLFSGEHRLDLRLDLVLEPERKSSWINWYAERNNFHASQEAADSAACHDRTHVLEVIAEDGKPVDVKIHEVRAAR